MSETCARCKSTGEDRRTLWMACFYQMGELGIPFVDAILYSAEEGADFQITKEALRIPASNGFPGITIGAPRVKTDAELTPMALHTLRVCKRCRGEWMSAIQNWFGATPSGVDHDADEPEDPGVGSGIFVRENGAIKEVTQEEFVQRLEKQEAEG